MFKFGTVMFYYHIANLCGSEEDARNKYTVLYDTYTCSCSADAESTALKVGENYAREYKLVTFVLQYVSSLMK